MRINRWLFVLLLVFMPIAGHAQSVNIDLGAAGQAGATARIVQLTALITVLSLAPSLLVMTTAFTRIVIVLSLLRSALSTQGTPPNVVLIGLALFLSFFVMQPTMDRAWTEGIRPMTEGRISEQEGLKLASEPFHAFMTENVRSEDLRFFMDLGRLPSTDFSRGSFLARLDSSFCRRRVAAGLRDGLLALSALSHYRHRRRQRAYEPWDDDASAERRVVAVQTYFLRAD